MKSSTWSQDDVSIVQVSKLGVTSILVSTATGVCLQSFEEGMKAFARNKSNRKSSRLDR